MTKSECRLYVSIAILTAIFVVVASICFQINQNKLEKVAEATDLHSTKLDKQTKAEKANEEASISNIECKKYYDIPLEEQYQDFVFKMCEKYSVPVNIVLGIMWQESKFDFMAVSSDKQCVGIMQVNRINYEELNRQLGVTDLRDPKQNIEGGIYIFSKLLHKYGDYHKALVCYNCGENGAKGKLTSNYSRDVINYAERLECM